MHARESRRLRPSRRGLIRPHAWLSRSRRGVHTHTHLRPRRRLAAAASRRVGAHQDNEIPRALHASFSAVESPSNAPPPKTNFLSAGAAPSRIAAASAANPRVPILFKLRSSVSTCRRSGSTVRVHPLEGDKRERPRLAERGAEGVGVQPRHHLAVGAVGEDLARQLGRKLARVHRRRAVPADEAARHRGVDDAPKGVKRPPLDHAAHGALKRRPPLASEPALGEEGRGLGRARPARGQLAQDHRRRQPVGVPRVHGLQRGFKGGLLGLRPLPVGVLLVQAAPAARIVGRHAHNQGACARRGRTTPGQSVAPSWAARRRWSGAAKGGGGGGGEWLPFEGGRGEGSGEGMGGGAGERARERASEHSLEEDAKLARGEL